MTKETWSGFLYLPLEKKEPFSTNDGPQIACESMKIVRKKSCPRNFWQVDWCLSLCFFLKLAEKVDLHKGCWPHFIEWAIGIMLSVITRTTTQTTKKSNSDIFAYFLLFRIRIYIVRIVSLILYSSDYYMNRAE